MNELTEHTARRINQRLEKIERKQEMTDQAVTDLSQKITDLTDAFNAFAADTNTTISNLIAKETQGGTIVAADLQPLSEAVDKLKQDVGAADTTVKGEDPGAGVAPTGETGEAGGVTPPTQSVYRHTGGGEVNAEVWPEAPYKIKGSGEQLYYYSGDTAVATPPTEAGLGVEGWDIYKGDVEAA